MHQINTVHTHRWREFESLHLLLLRLVALFFIGSFTWRWYSHLSIRELLINPLTYTGYSVPFMMYKVSGLEDFLRGHIYVVQWIDILLWASWIGVLLKPSWYWNRVLAFVLFFLYSVVFPVHLAFPVHYLSAMVVGSMLLLIPQAEAFSYGWHLYRYYACFVYSSAFVWKVVHGGMFDLSGVQVVKENIATYMILNPDTWYTSFYAWLIRNEWLLTSGTLITYLLEGSFILGFFTRKFDAWLIVFILLIHWALYLTVDTSFVEWYIFCLPFVGISIWQRPIFDFLRK